MVYWSLVQLYFFSSNEAVYLKLFWTVLYINTNFQNYQMRDYTNAGY